MSIKLENLVLASPEQMEFIIQGLRNPLNSHARSDSKVEPETIGDFGEEYGSLFELGENDHSLMQRLANAGTDHRKFMRMMPVYVRIIAPLYWWKEFDTYRVGVEKNSCSTMHKIAAKEFTFEDFSNDHLLGREDEPFMVSVSSDGTKLSPLGLMADVIKMLNGCREKYIETKDKKYWWQMIQLLPSSYNQTRNVMMNYEVLCNIYKSRKSHRLDEWVEFCKWIEELPYSELIVGEKED